MSHTVGSSFCVLAFLSLSCSFIASSFGVVEPLPDAQTKVNAGSDIDLQTCIDNFDIHKDKIIRTQDSVAMGAKYLNEIDLNSRIECLRLCCETENCDVFVYEEKNSGSCYLFQCGPPEDFKCKFTHHTNYTSAVLAVNRHMPDLENQIRLTKHEQDLTKLRKPEIISPANEPMPSEVQTTQTTTSTTVKTMAADNKTVQPTESRKCSAYQFECRASGECIAIYNACDGIPQCADGSDEASELRCPDSTTTTLPVQVHLVSQSQISDNPLARYSPVQAAQTQEVYRAPVVQHVNPQPPAVAAPSRPEADFLRPVAAPQYDQPPPQLPQLPQYAPYMPPQQQQQQAGWMPPQHPVNALPPQLQRYADKNSHIFNHKGNGLQVPDAGEASQTQYDDGHGYEKVPGYYGAEVYRQPIGPLKQNWPNSEQDYRTGNQYPESSPGGRETWSQNVPQAPANDRDKTIYKPPADKQLPANWKVEKEIPQHEQEKMAHELKHSKEHFEKAEEKNEPKKEEEEEEVAAKHGKNDSGKYTVVAEYKIAAEALEAIEDGVAETPGGALLSLTFGLIITSLLGILIGCRLRVVRRRMRRNGKSYAHDADYLVNGMYL